MCRKGFCEHFRKQTFKAPCSALEITLKIRYKKKPKCFGSVDTFTFCTNFEKKAVAKSKIKFRFPLYQFHRFL